MRLVVAALAAVHLACLDAPPGSTGDLGPPIDAAGDADGSVPVSDAPPPCTGGSWGAPQPVEAFAGRRVNAPAVSGDGALMIYDGGGGDLAVGTWNGETFVPASDSLVAALNTAAEENGPTLSDDGLTLWFLRNSELRVVSRVAGDDFKVDQPVAGYEGVELLGPEVLDAPGALALYFSISDALADTIFQAKCSAAASCSASGQVVELDEGGQERFPTLSRDGREIVFRSSAVPGLVSYRRSSLEDDFGERLELGVDATHPELASAGTRLYFVIDDDLYVMQRSCE